MQYRRNQPVEDTKDPVAAENRQPLMSWRKTAIDDRVKAEIRKFDAVRLAAAVEDKYTKDCIFDLCTFYDECAPAPLTTHKVQTTLTTHKVQTTLLPSPP